MDFLRESAVEIADGDAGGHLIIQTAYFGQIAGGILLEVLPFASLVSQEGEDSRVRLDTVVFVQQVSEEAFELVAPLLDEFGAHIAEDLLLWQ